MPSVKPNQNQPSKLTRRAEIHDTLFAGRDSPVGLALQKFLEMIEEESIEAFYETADSAEFVRAQATLRVARRIKKMLVKPRPNLDR